MDRSGRGVLAVSEPQTDRSTWTGNALWKPDATNTSRNPWHLPRCERAWPEFNIWIGTRVSDRCQGPLKSGSPMRMTKTASPRWLLETQICHQSLVCCAEFRAVADVGQRSSFRNRHDTFFGMPGNVPEIGPFLACPRKGMRLRESGGRDDQIHLAGIQCAGRNLATG